MYTVQAAIIGREMEIKLQSLCRKYWTNTELWMTAVSLTESYKTQDQLIRERQRVEEAHPEGQMWSTNILTGGVRESDVSEAGPQLMTLTSLIYEQPINNTDRDTRKEGSRKGNESGEKR